MAGIGASIMGGNAMGPRITLNLEDVVLHEQKLNTILDVSINNTLICFALFRN